MAVYVSHASFKPGPPGDYDHYTLQLEIAVPRAKATEKYKEEILDRIMRAVKALDPLEGVTDVDYDPDDWKGRYGTI